MSADFTVRQGGAPILVAVVARLGVSAVAACAIAYKVMYVATMAFYAVRQAAAIHTARTPGARVGTHGGTSAGRRYASPGCWGSVPPLCSPPRP
ncbi:hypothetical protein [Streptomyces sp. 900105245]